MPNANFKKLGIIGIVLVVVLAGGYWIYEWVRSDGSKVYSIKREQTLERGRERDMSDFVDVYNADPNSPEQLRYALMYQEAKAKNENLNKTS